jgi:hypothetical protein
MRIDEINLLGQFKITGNTGNDSQAIGMSGGSTSFIDVVASGGGSSEGLVKRSGYNYVIVEATGDALANGVKLKDAYIDVATLFNIGTPGIDNRFSILLTPGDYNLGADPLFVDASFIDIVGISQNPLDTIVRASGTFSTIVFDGTMDFGLYNIDLRSGETEEQIAFYDNGGTNTTYLRMKNVVISGNGFYNSGTDFFSFYDLDGEFEDITVLDGCNFALASNSLTGTFKNIKIGDAPYAFFGYTTLTGTYKNITISNLSNYGFYSSDISGIFEDIKINGGSNIFPYITSGYFKNIIISGSPTIVFTPAPGTGGIFEDIEISTAQTAFESGGVSIDGTFKNIKIGDVVNVFTGGSANILGTFSNIEIGNVSSAFGDAANISGSFKDIKVGNSSQIFSSNTDLTGTYENITIGDVDGGSCFTTNGGNISGTFKNITVGNGGSSFFTSATDLSGTFENIKSGDVLSDAFLAGNSILGTFKKISVKSSVGDFFKSAIDINGVFDDIYNSSSNNTFYSDGGILTGTFSNVELVNCGRSFLGSNGTSGYYDGFKVGSVSNFIFSEITTGTYKNIKIGSCTSFFTLGNTLGSMSPTLVENIEVGEVTSGNFIASGDALGGTYKNVKVGSVTGNAFLSVNGITGTYSNIEVGSCTGTMFYGGGNLGNITVNVDNLFVGTVSTIFDPGTLAANVTSNSKFNKLDVTGNCFGYALNFRQFTAKLTNSRINMIGRNDAMYLNGGQIERCKILTDASTMSGSGQVIYTMTNQSNAVTGATQCISDTSITS